MWALGWIARCQLVSEIVLKLLICVPPIARLFNQATLTKEAFVCLQQCDCALLWHFSPVLTCIALKCARRIATARREPTATKALVR